MANWQLTLPRVAWPRSEVVMRKAKGRGAPVHSKAVAEIRRCLVKALGTLDEIQAPPEIGAHIDFALTRLDVLLDAEHR